MEMPALGEPTTAAKTFSNCTLYRSGAMFGSYTAIRCRWVKVWVTPVGYGGGWAVSVEYMEKGKRKARNFSQSSHYSVAVAAGWTCPNPAGMFGDATRTESGLTVRAGRYSSFAPEWRAEFLRDVLPACTVLANYHGFDPLAAARRRAEGIDPLTKTLPYPVLADWLRERGEEEHADAIAHHLSVK